MPNAIESRPSDLQKLQQMVWTLQAEVALKDQQIQEKNDKIQSLLEQFRLAQQRCFGQSSESADQLGLCDESEAQAEPSDETPSDTQETTRSQRNQPKRKPLPKNLPREQVLHDLDEADKVCDCCGNDLHRMGEQTS